MSRWRNAMQELPKSGEHVLVVMENSGFWTIPMLADFFIITKPNGKQKTQWRIVDPWGEYREPYQFVTGKVAFWKPLPKMPNFHKVGT